MRCPEGHLLTLSTFGHLLSRQCSLCHGDIPRIAPRHRCWRCHYNLCYDCAVHLQWQKSGGTPVSVRRTSIPEEFEPVSGQVVAQLHKRAQKKQQGRQMSVSICKEHELADPATGTVRMLLHNRRRDGIADDCRFVAYSDDRPVVTTSPGGYPGGLSAVLRLRPELQQGISLAAFVLRRAQRLTDEVVGAEVALHQDGYDNYWQPRLPEATVTDGKQESLFSWMLGGGDLAAKMQLLCSVTQLILEQQPMVAEVGVPAKIFGDIHGQLRDLLLLFYFYGGPDPGAEGNDMHYIFNGDFVDRGAHQLESLAFLFSLKILYPDRVWLNRGNHEDALQNRKVTRDGFVGFDKACSRLLGVKKGPQIFEAAHRAFEWLPLAARIGGKILVVHGGLGDGRWTLDQLRSVQRPLESHRLERELGGVVYNVLWSDPLLADRYNPMETFGAHQSPRSQVKNMQNFGRDVTERFCKQEGLGMVVRSHQFKRSGRCFELMHDGWLMRIFSARNYCGRHLNDGGFLLVGRSEASPETLLVKPQSVERVKIEGSEAADGPIEPYCPSNHLMQVVHKEAAAFTDCLAHLAKQHLTQVCEECDQLVDQDSLYFVCRGCCDYCLCLHCASANSANGKLPADDSDDSDAESQLREADAVPMSIVPEEPVIPRPVATVPTCLPTRTLRDLCAAVTATTSTSPSVVASSTFVAIASAAGAPAPMITAATTTPIRFTAHSGSVRITLQVLRPVSQPSHKHQLPTLLMREPASFVLAAPSKEGVQVTTHSAVFQV